jgi:hypothetical protein
MGRVRIVAVLSDRRAKAMNDSTDEGLRFYFGAAAGSERKALQMIDEPNVMISHATKHNKPWFGIDNLFVDCGGYSLLKSDAEHPPLDEYIRYLQRWQPDRYALRDYPCEPDLLDDLNETVESHQQKTLEDHIEMLERTDSLDGISYPVIQGWSIEQYLDCIDLFRDHGIPLTSLGVGSVCRRNAAGEIQSVLREIRRELPDADLHGFGVKVSMFKMQGVSELLDSADSLAYSYAAWREHDSGNWKNKTLEYLKFKKRIEQLTEGVSDSQQTLTDSWGDNPQ